MNTNCSITIFLDIRRQKANGKYPVKLRVFTQHPRIQKLYPINYDLSKEEFDKAWNLQRPRGEDKEIKLKLQAILTLAENIAKDLPTFSFEIFEKKLSMRKGDEVNVAFLYQEAVEKLLKRGQIGTSNNYGFAKRSLEIFQKYYRSLPFTKLSLTDINKDWLEDYEHFMRENGKSPTTVSMYIRTLRTIFNDAIEGGNIPRELYPFGKGKYQPPSAKKVKKALSNEDFNKLFLSHPGTPDQVKAKDFWFFSFALNGMNIKDIANLKYKDITGDKMDNLKYKNIPGDRIEFFRAKTIHTSKTNSKPITVFLNDYTSDIIIKYGKKTFKPDEYIFDIIKPGNDAVKKNSTVKNFIKFINQHIKKLCTANGITKEVSTYWARHTFATRALRDGYSMEFMQESLGHGDLKTTQGYFAGFDMVEKKNFAQKIMDIK